MKSKVSVKYDDQEYPFLGIGSVFGSVVLYLSPGKGFVVDPGMSSRCVGFYADNFDMTVVKPLHGTVTLSNG